MHQYLFFIGDFPIRMYGLFFSLGIFSGCIAGYYFLKKDGHGWHESLFDLGLTIAVAGIIGGRLWDVFSLTGIIIIIISWKYLTSGRAAWPFREV